MVEVVLSASAPTADGDDGEGGGLAELRVTPHHAWTLDLAGELTVAEYAPVIVNPDPAVTLLNDPGVDRPVVPDEDDTT